MGGYVIKHSMDLGLHLVDTTSGMSIAERQVALYRCGDANPGEVEMLRALRKDEGVFILLNIGRRDFCLKITIKGYEDYYTDIKYSELDENLPFMEIHMVPSSMHSEKFQMLTLSGRLPGITEIDGIYPSRYSIRLSSYVERHKKLTITSQHKIEMDKTFYALVSEEEDIYERFTVLNELSADTFRIDHKLAREFALNSPITRIIFGRTWTDGSYLFRVRDDTSVPEYLVRYVVEGRELFKRIDFRIPETMKLTN